MAKFDYIKWVTNNKHSKSLLNEQAQPTTASCYVCDVTASLNGQNGQILAYALNDWYYANQATYGICTIDYSQAGPNYTNMGMLDPDAVYGGNFGISYNNCTGSGAGNATGSVPTCYFCDTTASMNGQNGQYTEPATMYNGSFDLNGNGYCQGSITYAGGNLNPAGQIIWNPAYGGPYISYANCTGSGGTTTPTTGSSGTTTTTGTTTTPINLGDPCEEFNTMDRIEQEDICVRCEEDPDYSEMCECCDRRRGRGRGDDDRGRERGREDLGEQRTNTHYKGNCCEWCDDHNLGRAIGNYPPEGCEDWNCNDCPRGGTTVIENKKIKMKKSILRKIIRESIKEVIVEQTAAECADITSQDMGAGVGYFFSCCEMGYYPNNPGNINDAQCKMHLDYGIITYGLTPQEVTNCCDPNWTGTTDGDCDDPLWVNMPAPNKMEYCNRCTEYGGGVAANGVFPVNLMAGAPYYQNDPNGLNYCKCCDDGSSGDMDCDNPEWVAQNPGAARKCFICQQAPAPCEQISNIPGMTVAIAQGMGLTLYNDQASCNSSTECGPSTGNRCDQMTQGVYDPDDPNHNDGWGMGCWFCHPEEGHPDFPGCTMITTPMSQWNAYNAYVAGTTGIYTTNAACQADPITKCGDEDPVEMIKCMCCDGNDPISMATEVPASQGCPGSYPGYTNCLLHPMSGGTVPKDYCKKIIEPVDIPIDDVEPMPLVKPVDSDREKKAIREKIIMKNIIKNILKK